MKSYKKAPNCGPVPYPDGSHKYLVGDEVVEGDPALWGPLVALDYVVEVEVVVEAAVEAPSAPVDSPPPVVDEPPLVVTEEVKEEVKEEEVKEEVPVEEPAQESTFKKRGRKG